MRFRRDQGFLEYETVGKGIPLLFIHGYPLSRQIWRPQIQGLADQAMVIAIDLRGHGDSFPFEGPYPMDMLADDCKGLLDELNIAQPAVICGLSMGGYITMALYRHYPQIFKGMILASTRPGPDTAEGKANRHVSIHNAVQHGSTTISDGMLQKIVSPQTLANNPELVKKLQSIMEKTSVNGIVGALQGMLERPDSSPTLAKVTCPVLIVHGEDDQIIPTHEAEQMHQLIPNSHLVIIPAAGHLANMEQPELFNRAVREFLSTLI